MSFPVSISLPFDHIDHPEEFISMEAVAEICRTAEAAGFSAGCVTDHPVPGSRWLDNGGHYAQDPFVMLSLIAAVTTKLRLHTNILVLPYRNPFITARSVATLDVFSGGRVILGMGAGYLKAEYKALGVDFDARNDLMDEYITAMKLAWTGEDFAFAGTGYSAPGNRMRPVPMQSPHPPLLVGGNSRRAIRRAVELGDAWHPFFAPAAVTATARTVSLAEEEDIDAALAYLHAHCEKVGRAQPPQIILSSVFTIKPGYSPQEAIDIICGYREKGTHGAGASIFVNSRAEWCELARDFGERVLPRLG
ncbi:TIGR03619 family F420-dependent LLM class oxidoreductase [Novosphingobium sp. TH158]|uniref:TIGR03619 family F420-dependent LLM class oxidoreductase n=1 Tax=Novosphingobium sp. TH158 TaxID=2067455 RepID=UPI000C7E1C9B|nr:TIGR03619 family F420-dependent LLM class oxidoreductase [Novosphingobium sp. TH158]PLK26202.1 LLM class F420-dependent oxidoreductase [Novosphingobium sp. TH158]